VDVDVDVVVDVDVDVKHSTAQEIAGLKPRLPRGKN